MDRARRNLLKVGAMAGAFASVLPGVTEAAGRAAESAVGAATPSGAAQSNDSNLPPEATKGPWRNLRAVREKKVFDFHTHAWETPVQGKNYAEEKHMHDIDQWKDYTPQLVASMDAHGVAQAALSPAFVPWEMYDESSYQKYPERFIKMTSMLTNRTKGRMADVTVEEATEILKGQIQAGCRGVGEGGFFWGSAGRYTVKDLKPFVEVILEQDIPVLVHSGWAVTGTASNYGRGYTAAWRWAERFGGLMSEYTDLKFVLGHTGGAMETPDAWEAIRLAYSFDNAYCEVSKSPASIITAAVHGIGADRVMFGSDWNRPEPKTYGPLNEHYVFQQWYTLNHVAEADITEDERDQILYKTARTLLKLNPA
jgi:predicted TIM-barrel fold metal-dependent hydrolase